MKKIIAFLICVCALIALVSCSGSGKSTVDTKDTAKDTATNAVTEAAAAKHELARGTIENGVYTNEYAGIRFTLPGGWSYTADEELAGMAGMAKDELNGKKLSELIEKKSVYDMMASSEDQLYNVNVVFSSAESASSDDEFLDRTAASLKKALDKVGVDDLVSEKVQVTLAGEARPGLQTSYVFRENGVKIFQKQAFLRYDGCVCVVTVTSAVEDRSDEFFAAFSAN